MNLCFFYLFVFIASVKNTINSCILCPSAWLLALLSGGKSDGVGVASDPHILPFLPFLPSKGILLVTQRWAKRSFPSFSP